MRVHSLLSNLVLLDLRCKLYTDFFKKNRNKKGCCLVLTWRVLACPKPGGARGSAFDSKSKGWWFDSTPGFRSGSSVGTIPSSSSFLFFLSFFFFFFFLLSFPSSFAALSFFLFRLRAHVFPESICLGAANYRGPVLRTDNTQPSLFSSSTTRMRLFPVPQG